MKQETTATTIESALCKVFSSFKYQPIEKNTIDQINLQCINIIRDFIDKGFIVIDEESGTIHSNQEVDGFDWLCVLPLAFPVMLSQQYSVRVNGKLRGVVVYYGMPDSYIEDETTVIIGANTRFFELDEIKGGAEK